MSETYYTITLANVTRCAQIVATLKQAYPCKLLLKEIAQRQRTALRYNEHLCQALRASGVLQGRRSPMGGYRLSDDYVTANVLQIVEAVWGPQDNPLIKAWANVRPEDLCGPAKMKLVA